MSVKFFSTNQISNTKISQTVSLFSNGSAGQLSVTTVDTIVNSYYSVSTQASSGSSSITVSSASGLTVNDKILIHQTSHSSNYGLWETNRIINISGNVLTLKNALLNTYYVGGGSSGASQIVKIPEYTTLTLENNSSVITPAWNGSYGGIIVLCARDLVINSGSLVSTYAKGYRFYNISTGSTGGSFQSGNQGETYSYLPYGNQSTSSYNGAGGGGAGGQGNYGNSGGGGGAAHRNNGGTGDTANPNGAGGAGGTAYGTTDLYARLSIGTGGSGGGTHDTGAGRSGGNGGGAIVLMADNIYFNGGTLNSKGGNTSQSYGNYTGGSSGGSGGSVVIFAKSTTGSLTTVDIAPGTASGPTGWTAAYAGASSQGRYALYTASASAPTLPSSQTLDVASGSFSYANTKLLA